MRLGVKRWPINDVVVYTYRMYSCWKSSHKTVSTNFANRVPRRCFDTSGGKFLNIATLSFPAHRTSSSKRARLWASDGDRKFSGNRNLTFRQITFLGGNCDALTERTCRLLVSPRIWQAFGRPLAGLVVGCTWHLPWLCTRTDLMFAIASTRVCARRNK
jgi:hypothetical protein